MGMELSPSLHLGVVAIEKGAFESPSTKGRQLYLLYGEACFIQNVYTYEPERRHADSPVEKKFQAHQSIKKLMPTVFLYTKRLNAYHFLKKLKQSFLLPCLQAKFTLCIELRTIIYSIERKSSFEENF